LDWNNAMGASCSRATGPTENQGDAIAAWTLARRDVLLDERPGGSEQRLCVGTGFDADTDLQPAPVRRHGHDRVRHEELSGGGEQHAREEQVGSFPLRSRSSMWPITGLCCVSLGRSARSGS
jgi:hypothetical protein